VKDIDCGARNQLKTSYPPEMEVAKPPSPKKEVYIMHGHFSPEWLPAGWLMAL